MGVYMYIYTTQNQSKCLFKNTHVGVDKCDHITLLVSSILRERNEKGWDPVKDEKHVKNGLFIYWPDS